MIRAVIFDFGNVICRFDIRLFLQRVSDFTGTSISTLTDILHQSSDLGRQYETGLITTDQFYNTLSGQYGYSVPMDAFVRAYTDIFTPIPSTLELIRHLKPHYKLGLLSNTNELHFVHAIQKVDVFPLFDAVTVSFQVKAMKPADAIYQDSLARLHMAAGECVYIDDVKENVGAAAHLGMHAIQFTTPEDLRAQLGLLKIDAL